MKINDERNELLEVVAALIETYEDREGTWWSSERNHLVNQIATAVRELKTEGSPLLLQHVGYMWRDELENLRTGRRPQATTWKNSESGDRDQEVAIYVGPWVADQGDEL